MLRSVSKAVGKRWTQDTEMLALVAEILHQLLLVTARAYGAKQHELPEALRVPRPYDADTQVSDGEMPDNVIGFGAFAEMVKDSEE